ncbi:unnamed protein product (macronuclear) [Paramecium tetraurelia]|uniref:Ubiquitin-like domain-containing protein n=1 Tax=Paramecium tetraurelia TaxID=5888 RepID=A0C7A7_PARTE|nr:uncharacterized protein GSPATT00035804001 [Paramecium tetraurelia]CAK66674.1 unnamed protein product [Paramecium tetraurelia]|eukprot:XP_001434071.1 hypothetical protein (macronuclear) [Paramecium tetraurelia strain d4-2]
MNNREIPIILVCKEKQKTYQVQVDIDSLVEDLITELHQLLQPGNQQEIVLYYNGVVLNQKKHFKDYKIVKGSTIEIIIKTHGGRLFY